MKRLIVAICWGLLALPVHGQVYKCVIDGKTHYAERPCAPNAKALDIRDETTAQRRLEARSVVQREQLLAAEKEVDHLFDEAERIRESGYVRAAQQRKKGRCEQLLRTAKDAKDESHKWRYHQGLIDDAKRRQKEAEDAHFSECYGN